MERDNTPPVRTRKRASGTAARRPDALSAEYRRLINRAESLPCNAPGASKDWVHEAHDEALRHLRSARRHR